MEWTNELKWLVEGIVTMSAMAVVAAVVYFWIDHFRE
jgi:ABC-type thiamin/hydroxymethylpyrimidine transport system permease subunit